jgi:DNA-binding IclR family transcriptional regulator
LTDATALREEFKLITQRGYSTDDEEFMAGMAAVAVPVLDENNRLVATLAVHAPTQRRNLGSLTQCLDTLQNGARKLSGLLAP